MRFEADGGEDGAQSGDPIAVDGRGRSGFHRAVSMFRGVADGIRADRHHQGDGGGFTSGGQHQRPPSRHAAGR